MPLYFSLSLGFLLSCFIGIVAYLRGSLTRGGMFGAILTGTLIFGFGGFVPGWLLVAFFVSSTLLSNYRARAKAQFNEKFQKGARRDFGQALANGGWAAFLAIAYGIAEANHVDERARALLFAAFVGAIATVTADTWATEIGVLSTRAPRMITTGRIVPAGTSGAITWLGTFTALLGAAFIGAMANVGTVLQVVLSEGALPAWSRVLTALASGQFVVLVASVSGLLGALLDSLLGATAQAIYFSEYDERQTEKKFDSQGNPTRRVRGWEWLDNDWVNFFASVFGSAVAAGLSFFIL